jgi:hypothetical protein
MAKVIYGGVVGQVSGSVGAITHSRNRYGTYIRRRTNPTQPRTDYQLQIRSILTQLSQAWNGIGDTNKTAWNQYAQTAPVVDSLGLKQVLTGHVAYIQNNLRLVLAGSAAMATPPTAPPPQPLKQLSVTAAAGAGTATIVYTNTPTGADVGLAIRAVLLDNPGVVFVKNRLKLIKLTGSNEASPYDIFTALTTRFGALVIGQKVVVEVARFDELAGQLSAPLRAEVVIAA